MKRCPRCGESKDFVAFYRNAARPDGHSTYCKPCETASSRPRRVSDVGRADGRARARKRRAQLIADMGGACACCGETAYEFLQFDHVDNNGAEHRRELGRTNLATSDVRRRMDEFQLLCANCNFAKGLYGRCPHNLAVAGLPRP